MPKVSVIIPVYNVEKYLSECLDSIINQTLRDIEIICVNDGSTDKSLEILNEYAQKDSRITVLTQENQGAAVARNKGLDFAKGEYLSILDSDDYFELDMLEKLYNKALEKNAEIVMCKEFTIFDNSIKEFQFINDIIPAQEVFSGKDISENIFDISRNIAWEKLFKASFIFDNNIRFHNVRIIDDAHFVFIAFALANRITILNECLIYHRVNISNQQTSITNFNRFPQSKVNDLILAYDKIRDSLAKKNIFDIYEKSYINRLCVDIMHYDRKLNNKNKKYLNNQLRKILFPKLNIFEKERNYYNCYSRFYIIQFIKNPFYKYILYLRKLYLIIFKFAI